MSNPRDRRLENDARSLEDLSAHSDFITAVPVDVIPGRPPEKYVVTLTCRGITGISRRDESPQYGDHHEVLIELTREYPNRPPIFRWLTDIWHPNIEHAEPHRVCIDQAHWQIGQTLDQIVLMLAEMVQYKNYHAESTPPYPLDLTVATWARKAEKKGWFSPTRPVDDRPLMRADTGARAPVPDRRIRVRSSGPDPKPPAIPGGSGGSGGSGGGRITFGARGRS